MASFWITFIFEWAIIPAFGLIFLSQRGRVTRAFSIFFFILGLPLAVAPQYIWLTNDAAGTTTELTFRPYPTSIILLALTIHLALIALAIEYLFDDIDRDWRGRKLAPKQSPL
jgi:hypothetical protein